MHIERDGARLFFTTQGNGPDVVLLHPTPTRHEFWLPMAEVLRARWNVRFILPDLRGHGQSELGAGPLTMEKLALDLHAVLAALGVQRAAFVGCSIGGYLLYEYWRRFPSQMTAMGIICGKPQPDSPANKEKRQEWMRSAQQPGGLANFFDLMADTLVGPTAQRQRPAVRTEARAMMQAMSVDAMIAVQQGLAARPDSVPTLRTITIPVCAIAGAEDLSSTPAEMQTIADQVPGAQLHVIPDAGHYAPLEQPQTVAGLLEEFLRPANEGKPGTAGAAH